MENKRKYIILTVIAMTTFVLITIGVSIAFFDYIKEGVTENSLDTGKITFIYEEINKMGNGIKIEDAIPTTDSEGKNDTKYFDFKIVSNTSPNVSIPYEITARSSGDDIGNIVKLYLTEIDGSNENELTLDKYNNLNDVMHNGYNEKILYKSKVPTNQENYIKNFRLRMWIDNNTDYSEVTIPAHCSDETIADKDICTNNENNWIEESKSYPYNNKSFSVTINVYSNGKSVLEEDNDEIRYYLYKDGQNLGNVSTTAWASNSTYCEQSTASLTYNVNDITYYFKDGDNDCMNGSGFVLYNGDMTKYEKAVVEFDKVVITGAGQLSLSNNSRSPYSVLSEAKTYENTKLTYDITGNEESILLLGNAYPISYGINSTAYSSINGYTGTITAKIKSIYLVKKDIESLSINNKEITPSINKDYDYYTVIKSNTASLDIVTADPYANVKIEKTESDYQTLAFNNDESNIVRLSTKKQLSLVEGDNYYRITLYGESGNVKKTYKLKIYSGEKYYLYNQGNNYIGMGNPSITCSSSSASSTYNANSISYYFRDGVTNCTSWSNIIDGRDMNTKYFDKFVVEFESINITGDAKFVLYQNSNYNNYVWKNSSASCSGDNCKLELAVPENGTQKVSMIATAKPNAAGFNNFNYRYINGSTGTINAVIKSIYYTVK